MRAATPASSGTNGERSLRGGTGQAFKVEQPSLDVVAFHGRQRDVRREPQTLREENKQQKQRRNLRHTNSPDEYPNVT